MSRAEDSGSTRIHFVLPVSPDYVFLQWFVNDVEGHEKFKGPRHYRLFPSDFLEGYLHTHSALYFIINSNWKRLQVAHGLKTSYRDYMEEPFGASNNVDSLAANIALKDFFRPLQIRGIPIGVVIFPRLVEVEGVVDNYHFGFLIHRVVETCRQQKVPCLDLRPILASVSPASKLWGNRLDAHPERLARAC